VLPFEIGVPIWMPCISEDPSVRERGQEIRTFSVRLLRLILQIDRAKFLQGPPNHEFEIRLVKPLRHYSAAQPRPRLSRHSQNVSVYEATDSPGNRHG
jgi:hypothetical protein